MTLLSKVDNDSINDNLEKRYFNGDIYVICKKNLKLFNLTLLVDIYWSCVN